MTISWRLTGSAKSRTLPAILPGMFDALAETGPVEEQANQEQAVPVDQASEVCSGACLRTFWLTR